MKLSSTGKKLISIYTRIEDIIFNSILLVLVRGGRVKDLPGIHLSFNKRKIKTFLLKRRRTRFYRRSKYGLKKKDKVIVS